MFRLSFVRDGALRAARTYALPLGILLVGWVIVVGYAYPGQMTQDSFDQLIEARAGIYTDSHPPAMAALWRIVDTILAGPLGMLVLQVTMFEVGLYLIFRRTFGRRGAAIAAGGLLVFPPVMLPMAVIWKDCLMAGFLTLGVGALLSSRRSVRIGALVLLMFATAFRYNALAATMPLVIVLFEWQPGQHWMRRYAVAVGAWLAITFMAFGVNAALTDQRMHYTHVLAVFDIVGTLAHVEPIPDVELERTLAGTDLLVHADIHAKMRAAYTPRNWLPILTGKRRALWSLPYSGDTPAPQDQLDAIARAWWDVVTSHPGGYLEHRFAVMAEVLCLGEVSRPVAAATTRRFKYPDLAHSLGISTEWADYQLTATNWMYDVVEHTPIFIPWLYLVLAVVWLLLTRKHRDMFALLISGLSMEASLLLLAASPDYRYSHWMITCTLIGMIVLIARRARREIA